MRGLARAVHQANRDRWSLDDAMALADTLIADRFLEAKSVGIEVVARYQKQLHAVAVESVEALAGGWPFGELGNHRYDLRCADRPVAAAVSRKGR